MDNSVELRTESDSETMASFNPDRSISDHVPRVPGPVEEYDLPLRTRDLPDVRGPDVRMSHLSEDGGEAHSPILVNFNKNYSSLMHLTVDTN